MAVTFGARGFRVAALHAVALAMLSSAAGPGQAAVQAELDFHRGVAAYGEGRLADARKAFERVLEQEPDDTAALHHLALIAQAGEPPDMTHAAELLERVLLLEPDNLDARFDLGAAYLELGPARVPEARALFEQVVAAQPDRANAHLYVGIAAYRMRDFEASIQAMQRALELDRSLEVYASYYTGLAEAYRGNFGEAGQALGQVLDQSPTGPFADSARNLREKMQPPPRERPWSLSISAGLEYDSNPTLIGVLFNEGQPVDREPDGRGIVRLRGRVRAYERGALSLTAGYDGYVGAHFQESEVDIHTHVGSLSASLDYNPVYIGLRYDLAYTWIDSTAPLRLLQRISPSVAVREGDWGVSQVFYQFSYGNAFLPLGSRAFNLDGPRHIIGFNQFLFPETDWVDYLRLGVLGDFYDPRGTEFRYDSWEVSAGFGVSLPGELSFTALYRYIDRYFRKESVIQIPAVDRTDHVQLLSLDVARQFGDHWVASVGATLNFSESNVDAFDFKRRVAGAYLTYNF